MDRLTNLLRTMGEVARGYGAAIIRRLETVRNGGRRRRMRVVESLALGGRRQLLLVLCDDQEYLVGTGSESVETIVPRQPTHAVAEHEAAAGQAVRGAERAKAAVARPVFGQLTGPSSGATSSQAPVRGGALLRESTARGPRLMTPAGLPGNRIAEGRTQEPEQSRGRHLWQ